MDPATMSYAQLLRAYQALQEHVIALEGAAALQHSALAWEDKAQHTTGTGAMVSVPEAYLTGGGEMGQRIRAYDWSATPLGPVETWPQSLKSAVSILLPSKAQRCSMPARSVRTGGEEGATTRRQAGSVEGVGGASPNAARRSNSSKHSTETTCTSGPIAARAAIARCSSDPVAATMARGVPAPATR